MPEKIGLGTDKVELENYKFSGLNASIVGAIQSVADYYHISLTPSWIYGMTGMAFLHVLDESLVEPNGGPTEPEIFRLARNIGVEIEGLHVYAEAAEFCELQSAAWEKAKCAINAKQPVFAKNLDIANQTSVIYAHDNIGYYTNSWHTGYENSENVIPWNLLGLSRCPCIHCENDRQSDQRAFNSVGGLISLHWASPAQPMDDITALKNALGCVLHLNEQGSYTWAGKTYLVGSKAYETWLIALESNEVDKYFFSLFLEILYEARSHAVKFLAEIKGRIIGLSERTIEEGIKKYNEVALRYKMLHEMYPYEEPRQSEIKQKEQCIAIVKELYQLEKDCFAFIKEIHATLSN